MNAGQSATAVGAGRRHQSGTLFQRGDGLFIGKVRDPRSVRTGRRRMLTVSSVDEAVAAEKLDRLIDDLDSEYAAAGGYSVAGWLRLWADEIHVLAVRPSTIRAYIGVIENHIIPALGDVPLTRLQPHHLRRMAAGIATSRTAVTADIVMRRALADAIIERLIDINPADAVRKPPHTPQPRDQLTADQARTFLAAAARSQDPWYSRWVAAFLLGARRGELLGLQWDRVDLDAGTVDFAWQLQPLAWRHGCTKARDRQAAGCGHRRDGDCPKRTPHRPRAFEHELLHKNLALVRPKTKAGIRVVPLAPGLWDLLTARLRRDAEYGQNPHNLVWHEPGGHPISPTDDHHRWKDALRKAGLPDVTCHSARATAATLLADEDVDEDTRMRILGHVSATAHRLYRDIDAPRIRGALFNLDQLMPEGNEPQ